jgi:hypothetical protein
MSRLDRELRRVSDVCAGLRYLAFMLSKLRRSKDEAALCDVLESVERRRDVLRQRVRR